MKPALEEKAHEIPTAARLYRELAEWLIQVLPEELVPEAIDRLTAYSKASRSLTSRSLNLVENYKTVLDAAKDWDDASASVVDDWRS